MTPIPPTLLRFAAAPQPKLDLKNKSVADLEAMLQTPERIGSDTVQATAKTGAEKAEKSEKAEEPFFRPRPLQPEQPKRKLKQRGTGPLARLSRWIKHRFVNAPFVSFEDKQLIDLLDRLDLLAAEDIPKMTGRVIVRPLKYYSLDKNFEEIDATSIQNVSLNRIQPTEFLLNGQIYTYESRDNTLWTMDKDKKWQNAGNQNKHVIQGNGLVITLDQRTNTVIYEDTQSQQTLRSNNSAVYKQAQGIFQAIHELIKEKQNFYNQPLPEENRLRL